MIIPAPASADGGNCAARFPDVDWTITETTGPVALATAGMNEATSLRFASDVDRVAAMVQAEVGGLDGAVACLTTPEIAPAFNELVAPGQRLHVAIFAEDKMFVLSAVETRMIDDAIAFGIPHIGLWHLADELGLDEGYPEPLGSTIAHWYLARDTDRLARYRTELIVPLYLDDPNPEERTLDDASMWVGDMKPDPFLFDPQFIGSQMGVFIDYAVAQEGPEVLRAVEQDVWGGLENRWRVSIRDEFPRGNFGVWWGVGIVVFFTSLAIFLALDRRRRKKKAARRRPTPPVDESLFVSQVEDQ